ncbi:hypothetical protein ABID97_002602 [Variovorax sp. OAS795]|uniref:hypothetical protein n=1 Tax=Variovorax sp. OAS795 TaxID=3034231 RepID=UPI003390EF8B
MNFQIRGMAGRRVPASLPGAGALLLVLALAGCGGGDNSASLPAFFPTAPPPAAPPAAGPGPGADVACTDIDGSKMNVKAKTITINNNTAGTIYPVLATSQNATNEWIQACFRDTSKPYPTKFVYKLYVNEGVGLAKGASVTITLPLFSVLSKEEDRYITWWNGGRVLLADNNARLRAAEDVKLPDPVGISCTAGCNLTTYSSVVGLPENVYAQLSEYTFGASIFPPGDPKRLLKPENVGYNISYVDHVYMPVAIGVRSNPYIGFSGSAQALDAFRQTLRSFLTTNGDFWPVYNLSQLKLPGAYNTFAQRTGDQNAEPDVPVGTGNLRPTLVPSRCVPGNDGFSSACTPEESKKLGVGVQRMQNLWGACVNWGAEDISKHVDAQPVCPDNLKSTMEEVKQFFQANQAKYVGLYASTCDATEFPPTPFNFLTALSHIYGWVPFNERCGAGVNALAETPGWDHAKVQLEYIQNLQYNYDQTPTPPADRIFNPYVKLIHKDLDMAAYGFSVDDSVGFMSELGDGLVFNVGGTNGLENEAAFNYVDGFSVSTGGPDGPENIPVIKKYGACALVGGKADCGGDVIMPTNTRIMGFRVGTPSAYPLEVHFTDAKSNEYKFTVKKPFAACKIDSSNTACAPIAPADLVDPLACSVVNASGALHANSAAWCRQIVPVQAKTGNKVENYFNTTSPVDLL